MGIDRASAGPPVARGVVVVDRQDERGRDHVRDFDSGEVEVDDEASAVAEVEQRVGAFVAVFGARPEDTVFVRGDDLVSVIKIAGVALSVAIGISLVGVCKVSIGVAQNSP